MKPLNLDNRPCSPISSNCVIWQGPDIPCISLCTGDSVSDVVAKLGTELCTIMEQLNISNYDLACLGLAGCPPKDITALINLLIDKVCETTTTTTSSTSKSASGCPDCVVTVAPCFVQGTTTNMQLLDYVQMIANRVCGIISEIASINDELEIINTTLVDLQNQIDNLPTYTLPSFSVNCILSSGAHALDVIVEALINDNTYGYCVLLSATGNPSDINAAVLSQCIADTDQPLSALPSVTTFSAFYSGSWVNNATLSSQPNIANSIKNIWVAVCDLYNYTKNLSISVNDTATIDLTYESGLLTAKIQDTGWVNLEGFDYYAGGFASQKPQCRRIGNQIQFRGVVYIPLATSNTGTTKIDITATSTYFAVTQVTPFQNTGGIFIDSNGFMYFNSSGVAGQSVIPTTVLSAGQNLDNIYRLNNTFAFRKIAVSSTNIVTLNTNFGVAITDDKRLRITPLNTFEGEGGYTTLYGSPARLSTSNIRSGEYIPNYIAAGSDIHNAPSNANFPLVSDTYNLTWPITCNAADPTQIGGFGFVLDGLVAFVEPCNTDIKSHICSKV